MRRRLLALLADAERNGTLYLYAGCASAVGAVALTLSPTAKPEEGERRTAVEEGDSLVHWALSTAESAESVHNQSTTLAQRPSSTSLEAAIMSSAPLEGWPDPQTKQAVAADPRPTVSELGGRGLSRVDGCLSGGVVAELLSHVNSVLADACSREKEPGSRRHALAEVLCPTQRWDLKLALAPPVVAALREALGPLALVCEAVLGPGAVLHECAALVADPDAPRQPMHPDSPSTSAPAMVTVFIALQDVHATMGPTVWLPHTHTADAHAAFNAPPASGAKRALLASSPRQLGVVGRGDAVLFDSRLLHCGTANESDARRVIFYFSFRAAAAQVPLGSLDADLQRRKLRLDSRGEWLGVCR